VGDLLSGTGGGPTIFTEGRLTCSASTLARASFVFEACPSPDVKMGELSKYPHAGCNLENVIKLHGTMPTCGMK
jgi:hypothetical protein